jgi:nucleotide-binding universal stress UspA family protein
MNSSNYKMLFPVDFSSRSISAVEHVSLWRRHFGASLETVHIVDNQRYESRYDHSIYSRVVARRTADLEYFCLHQFGKDVAHAIVLAGSRANQVEMVRQLVINFGAEVTFLQVTGNAEAGESGRAAGTEAGPQLWMAQARDLLGSSKKLLRRPSKVIPGIRETADEIGADLVVVGRMRPEAISFGRQSLILKIDHAVRCPVLSVW